MIMERFSKNPTGYLRMMGYWFFRHPISYPWSPGSDSSLQVFSIPLNPSIIIGMMGYSIFHRERSTSISTLDWIKDSENLVEKEEFETIHANIKSIKNVHETVEKITSEEFVKPILETRKNELETKIEEAKIKWNEQVEEIKENLKMSFEEEKKILKEELKEEFKEEQKELLVKIDEDHKKEIDLLGVEYNNRLEQALEEQRKKFEEEKKKLLEEQEEVLRTEFQRLLSESQDKKRR